MARNYDDLDDFNLNDFDYDSDESFTLESILAEYKGTAFIEDERKTPSGVLDEKTDAIMRDALAGKPLEDDVSKSSDEESEGVKKRRHGGNAAVREKSTSFFKRAALNTHETDDVSADSKVSDEFGSEIEEEPDISDVEPRFKRRNRQDDGADSFAKRKSYSLRQDEPTDAAEDSEETSPLKSKIHIPKISLNKLKSKLNQHADSDDGYSYSSSIENENSDFDDDFDTDNYRDRISVVDRLTDYFYRKKKEFAENRKEYDEYDEDVPFEDSEPYIPEEEPSYKEESKRFASGLASLALREIAILVIGIVAVIFNVLSATGTSIPFGIGTNNVLLSGILLIMQLASMALGIEIIISGISDILILSPGAESLITVSSIFTAVDAAVIVISGNVSRGLPYCVVSIVAIYFAVLGRKSYRLAMAETLRMAATAANPSAVISDPENIEDRSILKKVKSDLAGFWRMSTTADIAEDAYSMASPILMVAALCFAILSTVFRDNSASFTHAFASLLAVSASFSSVIAFALPFRLFTKRTRMSGGAIAGWGGVAEISESDGVLITDSDIFPKGTVSLSGVKVFEGANANRIIGYTGSLIMLSRSGLSDVFEDFMRTRGINRVNVEKFSFYEGGGLGGRVFGENILVGSSGFMNLMGIRIPDSIYEKNAIFTAVNNRLVAAFSMNYAPSNSVRYAILSLLRSKISMLFAAKDANLTPVMLQQKFKVSVDGIEYIPVEDCYKISVDEVPERCETLGIVYRAGLGPFASVISCAKRLKNLATLTTILSVASSFIGIIYVFFLCWSGSFVINTAVNILLYLGLTQIIVYILILLYNRR